MIDIQEWVQPQDVHNRELIKNVHPMDWMNPKPKGPYHLVVIGAGTAGLVAAVGAAGLGARVALVERALLGGDCLNYGCVPSKSIIRSARVMAEIQNASQFGALNIQPPSVNFAAVMERMRRIRARISQHDSASRLRDLGVDVYLGEASFTSPRTVEVDGQRLEFKKAVIATGARAVHPEIEGLEQAGYYTNETIFNLTERPPRLIIIGAGPIGCEMAQAFRRLGSQVILIGQAPQLLPREDRDAVDILGKVFHSEGIQLLLGTRVVRVTPKGREKIVHGENSEGPLEIPGDAILVGVGRAPNIEGLNLEAADVAYQPFGVEVNEYLQTTNPRIYAAGDICLPYKFTHTADATARIAVRNALFPGKQKWTSLVIPWCTYTDPEIAHVGMNERMAAEKNMEIDTYKVSFSEVDRALADGEEEGFVKIHTRKGTDHIVGATLVAPHAGEMINEITLAMRAKIGLRKISSIIHPYPTQAEAIRKAADTYLRGRLTPMTKKILRGWFRLF